MEVEDASRATTCFVANFAVDQSKCTTCTLQVTTAHIYNSKGEHCVLGIIHAMGCPGVGESVCVTCSSCSCTCGRRQGGCGEVRHGCGAFWSRGSFVRALQFDHGCLGLLIMLESRQLEVLWSACLRGADQHWRSCIVRDERMALTVFVECVMLIRAWRPGEWR
jgi:hypothetical protein